MADSRRLRKALSTILWSRCLLPMAVKQIHGLANNDQLIFITGRVEVNNVTIVGRVCLKEDKAGNYTFLVEDGTGQIECPKSVQQCIDADELAAIPPVTDSNEIHSHLTKCVYVHFYKTRLQKGLAIQPHSGMNNTSKGYQAAPPNHFMDRCHCGASKYSNERAHGRFAISA